MRRLFGASGDRFFWSLVSLWIMLVALFFFLRAASRYAPSPVSGIAQRAAGLATPTGY